MKKGEILKGLSVSSGVGIGEIHKLVLGKVEMVSGEYTTEEGEIARLKEAIDCFCYRTYGVFQKMRSLLGHEDALILGGQIFMARDLEFVGELHQEISEGYTAEQAISRVFTLYLSYFQDMEDELMSQRGTDLADMRDSILEILCGQQKEYNFYEKKGVILCANDLTPSVMATLSPINVSGILCQKGGITSHCAILARATGIPAIFGISQLLERVEEGEVAVVDGAAGLAVRNPETVTLEKYQEKSKHFQVQREELELFRDLGTKSASGEKISLMANISNIGQIHTALELGADGVGLFRTEYLFMEREELPTEEEQFRAYCRVASKMDGKPMVIRTLDIGGDKEAECLVGEYEENPFLGQRAVRYCLEHKDIFATQLRAILRASGQHENISLLIPFVTEVDEIFKVRELLSGFQVQLQESGIPVNENLPFGVVVETPSAAIMIDRLVDIVDFVSVGTNDLTQYMMAADRGNVKVAEYYNTFHVSVVRVLKFIINCCNSSNVPVTVCGESVSDPRMVPLLMAFGEVTLSVSPSSILTVRREIAAWTKEQAEEVARSVLKLTKTSEIERYLSEVMEDRERRLTLFERKVEKVAMG